MMSPRIPMPKRSFRCDESTWQAAQDTADQRGDNLSEEIRKFLVRYAKKASK